jgi:hypothetical protein
MSISGMCCINSTIGHDAHINIYQTHYKVTSILCFLWSCFESTMFMRVYKWNCEPGTFLIIRNTIYLHLHTLYFQQSFNWKIQKTSTLAFSFFSIVCTITNTVAQSSCISFSLYFILHSVYFSCYIFTLVIIFTYLFSILIWNLVNGNHLVELEHKATLLCFVCCLKRGKSIFCRFPEISI